MSYIIANNKVHTDPPKHVLSGGQKTDSIPAGIEILIIFWKSLVCVFKKMIYHQGCFI